MLLKAVFVASEVQLDAPPMLILITSTPASYARIRAAKITWLFVVDFTQENTRHIPRVASGATPVKFYKNHL